MILASIAAIAAAQAAPLQPSSKWNVDYGKDMCTVGRSFGDDGVTFGFRPDGFAGQGGMLVVLQPAKSGSRFRSADANASRWRQTISPLRSPRWTNAAMT